MNNNPYQDTAKLLAALEEEEYVNSPPETDYERGKVDMAKKLKAQIGFGAFVSTDAKQMQEERDEYKKLLHEKHDELCKVTTLHGKEIERCAVLGKDNAKLVKALEFYISEGARGNSDLGYMASLVLSELRGREEQ